MTFAWSLHEADEYVGRYSRGWIWRPAPNILVTRLVGRAEISGARFYIDRGEQVIAQGHKLTTFHDWWDIEGYDPESRDSLRAFGLDKRRFDDVHYLIRSTLVALAVTTATMTLGRRLHAHSRREVFLERLEQALDKAAAAADTAEGTEPNDS